MQRSDDGVIIVVSSYETGSGRVDVCCWNQEQLGTR